MLETIYVYNDTPPRKTQYFNGIFSTIIGTRARFLSPARSKLRLCSANHRAGYFSNLACDWWSIVWAYSEQGTENGPRFDKTLFPIVSIFSECWIIFTWHIFATTVQMAKSNQATEQHREYLQQSQGNWKGKNIFISLSPSISLSIWTLWLSLYKRLTSTLNIKIIKGHCCENG